MYRDCLTLSAFAVSQHEARLKRNLEFLYAISVIVTMMSLKRFV